MSEQVSEQMSDQVSEQTSEQTSETTSEPTSEQMSEHNYKFNVQMSCGGCSGAVERVLKKLEGIAFQQSPLFSFAARSSFHTERSLKHLGVKSYNVSLDTQTADVVTTDEVSFDTVLKKIKNTGKTVISGEADGVVMAVA
jgi:copper chaperone